eukprot:116422-Rhodomonas_salina.1
MVGLEVTWTISSGTCISPDHHDTRPLPIPGYPGTRTQVPGYAYSGTLPLGQFHPSLVTCWEGAKGAWPTRAGSDPRRP